ncbi:MAG: putative DNA-binding domain-containing protein [Sandaracinaceae bacterium]|nr:putative DNA-binding domain-containing protein [Sandaracinaceae bacterium]
MKPAPEWLGELQARFGEVLRTPLDRSTGTLAAATSSYAPEALGDVVDGPATSGRDRLAVYNRQYWFRLFRALATAFPITARVVGPWDFNEHASRFLLARPPRGWDLERVPDGFDAFLERSLEGHADGDLILEAARLDATWRRLTRAPTTRPFRPDASAAATMPDARLTPSEATAVVVERWPLMGLARSSTRIDRSELPRLPQPRFWALAREATGIRRWALEPREGELLLLLQRYRVRDALARLEASCTAEERAALPAKVERWLAHGAERGLWSGVRG